MIVAVTEGLNISRSIINMKPMVVRAEQKGDFATLSIADEASGDMLQIVVNEPVKKLLNDIIRKE